MLTKILVAILSILFIFSLVTLVRSLYFINQTKKLTAISATFPIAYNIGSDKQRQNYTVLGDSTVVGIGATRLEETIPYIVASFGDVRIENYAVSGAKINDIIQNQLPKLKPNQDVVIISISANDAARFTDEAEFLQNLTTLLDAVTVTKARRILLTNTPNLRNTPALPGFFRYFAAKKSKELSRVIDDTAKRYPNVAVIDLHNSGELSLDEYASDRFHPGPNGYKKWGQLFRNAL